MTGIPGHQFPLTKLKLMNKNQKVAAFKIEMLSNIASTGNENLQPCRLLR